MPLAAIHALLNDRPFALVGHEETMQVKVKAVLYRGAVDFGHKAAGRVRASPSIPMRSPSVVSSSGVRRECLPRPPQT
jgi:hypothetical protein